MITTNKTGFIGVGNMAGAILNGMIDAGIENPGNIVLYDICAEKTEKFSAMGCRTASSERELVQQCSTVVLAIKPQGFEALLKDIADLLDESKLIISIAAGISIDYINSVTGKTLPIVRCLPNTPMTLGVGVSALTYRAPATEVQYEYASRIFRSCGKVFYVDEDKFDEIICVHSSSPAYFFLMVKAMADSAAEQGIDRKQAMEMIIGTILGAAKMMDESGFDCDQLISMVASKGGTTEASLRSFSENGFSDVVDKAMKACTQRAKELGGK